MSSPLGGSVRAIVFGDEPALYTGRFLAELGASVIVIEPPGGHPIRRQPPFFADPPQSVAWWTVAAGCQTIESDLTSPVVLELLAEADAVIESLGPGELDRLGLGRKSLDSRNPGLVQTSISSFGQDGPYRDWMGGDLIEAALGGLLSLVGDPDRAPVRIGAPQPTLHAAGQALLGTMIALNERADSGVGQTVDVSVQAATAWATHPTRQLWLLEQAITRRAGVRRPFGERSRRLIYPCLDGYVAVQGVLGREWPAFLDWLAEDGLDGPLREDRWLALAEKGSLVPGSIPDHALDELDQKVLPFFARHLKRDLYEGGQARRIIIFPVNDATDIVASPQLAARGSLVDVPIPGSGGTVRLPGPTVVFSKTPSEKPRWPEPIDPGQLQSGGHFPARASAKNPTTVPTSAFRLPPSEGQPVAPSGVVQPSAFSLQPSEGPPVSPSQNSELRTQDSVHPSTPRRSSALAGLRIVDLSWVGAGPLTTMLLAVHGAEVIRVESSRRPDVLRVTPPFLGGKPNIDGSGYYHPLNAGKRGIAINLASVEGQDLVRELVKTADVVVESFTPRVLAGWGLDYHALCRLRPDLVMLSLSMVGQTGPYRDHLGFGTVLQASAGFAAITGWPDRDPVASGLAYTDWFVPLFAAPALLAAIDHRRRTGEGQYLDCSQFEAALPFLGTTMFELGLTGKVPGRHGNRLFAGGVDLVVPHGVYRCHGTDRWIAIACYDDRQWRRLTAVIGAPPVGEHATIEMRREAVHLIDRWLTEWLGSRDASEAMVMLQEAGVPAGVVHDAAGAAQDPGLAARGFGVRMDHPTLGPMPYDPPAFVLERTPACLNPAPALGHDTEWALVELLGLSEDRYGDLWAADALG